MNPKSNLIQNCLIGLGVLLFAFVVSYFYQSISTYHSVSKIADSGGTVFYGEPSSLMEIIVSGERKSEFETRESWLFNLIGKPPRQVRIEANKKEHLDSIGALTSIRVLVVEGPGVIDLGRIRNLRHLEVLIVFNGEILNAKSLKDFPKLKRFTHVGLPSIDVNNLVACAVLEHVNLPEYPDEYLAELVNEKPSITHGFSP